MNDTTIMADAEKTMIGVPEPGEATQMVMAPQGEATQYGASIQCPVCQTPNPPSETYCTDCGFLLTSEPVAIGDMPKIAPGAKLVAADGMREYLLKPGQNTVGRENADVLLSSNTVSRRHATVIVEESGVFVEDPGSTNGTTVDGRKVAPGDRVQAKSGSEIVFGSAAVRLEMPEPEAAEQPEPEAEVTQQVEAPELIETTEAGAEEPAELIEPAAEPEAEDVVVEEIAAAGTLVSKDGALRLTIKPGVSSIGRREGNDIVIADAYCSGSHAELLADGGKFTLTDLGSTNGTFINGVKIDPNAPGELQAGDEITFGQMVFQIEVA